MLSSTLSERIDPPAETGTGFPSLAPADGLFVVQAGRIVQADGAGLGLLGAAADTEVVGRTVERFVSPAWRARVTEGLARLEHGRAVTVELPLQRLDGSSLEVEVVAVRRPWREGAAVQLIVRDTSARRLAWLLLDMERAALELIARDLPLERVLAHLCRAVEAALPDSLCSVLLVDPSGRRLVVAAAPSLPDAYSRGVDGLEIGPRAGSCGTAAWSGRPFIVPDIERSPEWDAFRSLAAMHGLRACWSIPFFLANGEVTGTFAVYHRAPRAPADADLRMMETTARLAQVAVQQSRMHVALDRVEVEREVLLRTVASGILTIDASGRILGANPAACAMLELPERRLVNRSVHVLLEGAVTADGTPLRGEGERADAAPLAPVRDYVLRMETGAGNARWLSINLCALPAVHGGRPDGAAFVCSFDDVTEMKRAHERLTLLASRDDLTSLPNRTALAQDAQQAIEQARQQGTRLAMLVLDLDGFKHVNDTLGHAAGDVLLREVARRLAAVMRPDDMLARRSGDEFVILAPGADARGAEAVAGRVHEALRRPFMLADKEVFVGASIGAAVFPEHGDTEDALFGHADAAMYRAKRKGPNTFALHEDAPAPAGPDRLTLETQLRYAIARDELLLHYQPRIDAASGRITGAEALVRWNHPEHGLVSPAAFIPLAEETGLIVPLGEWVLREACRQAADWDRQGLPPVQVAVNVSARQFDAHFLSRTVPEALERAGLPPGRLELEITESTMMGQCDAATMEALQALRDRGTRLVLDDFGTGYSSLSYLHRFPLDGLKIDRGFVMRLEEADDARQITRAVLSLAATMKLRTVAEGVETPGQCDWLIKNGSDELQGFLFSRPVPPDDFAASIRRRDEAATRTPATGADRCAATVPRPDDEAQRLQALRASGALTAGPDGALDAITAALARFLDMPMAAVTLLDETELHVRAAVGLTIERVPRDLSFCSHALLGTGPMVVEDALQDPRFACNPLVVGPPGVRFYAGVPIRARDASGLPRRIGSLCVLDQEPRTLDARRIGLLTDMARAVGHILQRARD